MISISKNLYIDISDEIVNKCSNTYQGIIKMKPADGKSNIYWKVVNLKLVVILAY